jgi:hypothetical protein
MRSLPTWSVAPARQSLARSRFKKEQLIQIRGSSILILAPELLERLAV